MSFSVTLFVVVALMHCASKLQGLGSSGSESLLTTSSGSGRIASEGVLLTKRSV